MNNNPIGWPDNAFGYNASTQTLTAPTVAATKAVTVNAPSSYTGNLLDLQVGGKSRLSINNNNTLTFVDVVSNLTGRFKYNNYWFSIGSEGGTDTGIGFYPFTASSVRVALASSGAYTWSSSSIDATSAPDLYLHRDAANTLAQRNGTNAQTFRPYNTYTSATNYERGKLEWSGNVFNVGTEKGSGGGTARSMALQTDATDRLTLDTVGSVRVTTGLTVATLPASPTVGMIARVTNALSPTIGSTVAGGGAANALCWYNGTNWTVMGI